MAADKTKVYRILIGLLVILYGFPVNSFALESDYSRLYGENRYETACAIALEGWESTDYVILASGQNFPDALAATPLARYLDAPILLTEKDSLPDITLMTMAALDVTGVVIVGGTGTISEEIEEVLQSLGVETLRIAGKDRFETSVKIAAELAQVYEIKEAVFATGSHYANALAVASIAANRQMPIILLPQDHVPECVLEFVMSMEIQKSFIIGSERDIGMEAESRLPNPERVSGTDIYDTCLQIMEKFPANYAVDHTVFATGDNFADALAGTAFAAKISAPVVLVNTGLVDFKLKQWIASTKAHIHQLYLLGGNGALPSPIVRDYLGISGTESIQFEDESFSFRYPSSWERIDQENLVSGTIRCLIYNSDGSGNNINVVYEPLHTEISSEEYFYNNLGSYAMSNIQPIRVGGIEAISADLTTSGSSFEELFFRQIFVTKGNQAYVITYTSASSGLFNRDLSVLGGIVESFEFK